MAKYKRPSPKNAGDRLAYELARRVISGEIGSRSALADALMDYMNVGGIGGPISPHDWIKQYKQESEASDANGHE